MKPLLIIKGDDTNFDNNDFCTILINSDEDLTGYSASLELDTATNHYDDISSGEVVVNFSATQTNKMQTGQSLASFRIYDSNKRSKMVVNFPVIISDTLPAWEVRNPDIDINLISVTLVHNTREYNNLRNLPLINEVVIEDSKNGHEYGLANLDDVDTHNVAEEAHPDIRELIRNLTARVVILESIIENNEDTNE